MRTLGLIGGMSWESTAVYYHLLNQKIRQRRGGLSSADLILYSVDFAPIAMLQANDQWDEAGQALADVAAKLEAAGAKGLVLCTNTMHIVANHITNRVSIPLLHLADATASTVRTKNFKKVGFLGTAFTMEQAFYKDRLEEKANLEVLVPGPRDRKLVHEIIFDELCQGKVLDESRQIYLQIIAKLVDQGAQAIIAGCTEIGLLIKAHDLEVPLYDTTEIHAESAIEFSLSDGAETSLN